MRKQWCKFERSSSDVKCHINMIAIDRRGEAQWCKDGDIRWLGEVVWRSKESCSDNTQALRYLVLGRPGRIISLFGPPVTEAGTQDYVHDNAWAWAGAEGLGIGLPAGKYWVAHGPGLGT